MARFGAVLQFFGSWRSLACRLPKSIMRFVQCPLRWNCVIASVSLLHAVVASQSMTYAVRLGLHTGLVAVASLSGEMSNLAIWLRYHAVPDTIFASGATIRLVHGGWATPRSKWPPSALSEICCSDIWMRPIKRPSSESLSSRQHNLTTLSNIRLVIAARHGKH